MIIRSGSSRVAVVLSLLVLADSTSLVQADPKDASAKDRLRYWNQVAIDYQRTRSHAGRARRAPRLRRAVRTDAGEPGHGDRAHRDLRRGERDRRPLRRATPASPDAPATRRWTPRSRGGARHARRPVPFADSRSRSRPRGRPHRIRSGQRQGQRHRPRQTAAAAILALRNGDGSDRPEPQRRHRFHHGQRAREVAAGPDQPEVRWRWAPTGAR